MTYTQAKECINASDKETLKELIKRFGEDLVLQYHKDGYDLNTMEEAYQGEYKSDEDFVQNLLEDLGAIPNNFPAYIHIDWEATARDVMIDYFEIDGHYFRNL